jgi:DNA-binding MarR family transcriptional regulator
MDDVDKILDQWRDQRPDLDTSAMGPIGRLVRLAQLLSRQMGKTFAHYDLNISSFDVLATLRRSAPPHRLSAGELMASMMITSGTMTNRIDQLEKVGLVSRTPDPNDARRALVGLTPQGYALIDQAIASHVETQTDLVSGLTEKELAQLDDLLRKLMKTLERVT